MVELNPEPKSELRAAVRRLIAAIRENAAEITVLRRDVEVLLAVNAERRAASPMPRLHPEQR